MAIWDVSPSGVPHTLRHAAASASPGDTVRCASGVYGNTAANRIDANAGTVASGSAGGFITYVAADPASPPVFQGLFDLRNTSYLRFIGLRFESWEGEAWIKNGSSDADTTSHLELRGCQFDQPMRLGDQTLHDSCGIHLVGGDHLLIANCKIGSWYNSDAIQVSAFQHVYIEGCRFIQAKGGHSILAVERSKDVAIRLCTFNNPWDRAVTINNGGAANKTRRLLVDRCLFIGNDWDQIDTGAGSPDRHPYLDWTKGGDSLADKAGAGQNLRFLGERLIFRDSLILAGHPGQIDQEKAAFNCSTFSSNVRYTRLRVYNNTLYLCATRGMYFEDSGDGLDTSNNKFRNNIVASCVVPGGGSGVAEFRVRHERVDWESWEVDHNLFWHANAGDKVIGLPLSSGGKLTAAEADAAHPQFHDNLDAPPSFIDATAFLAAFDANPFVCGDHLLPKAFCSFRLTPGSIGKGDGAELARVTSAGSGLTTVQVDDANWFWAGNDYAAGDSVIIGSLLRKITAVNGASSPNTITLDSPITVAVGDKIYLERMTTTPNRGTTDFPDWMCELISYAC